MQPTYGMLLHRIRHGKSLLSCILPLHLFSGDPLVSPILTGFNVDFFEFFSTQLPLFGLLAVLVAAFIVLERKRAGAVLSHHEVTRMLNRDEAVLLDVRDKKDYAAGHITDALNIPFAKLKDRMSELEKHKAKTIVIADKMGQHGGAAVKQLSEAGFQAARLQGGMVEWQAQNLPTLKS